MEKEHIEYREPAVDISGYSETKSSLVLEQHEGKTKHIQSLSIAVPLYKAPKTSKKKRSGVILDASKSHR